MKSKTLTAFLLFEMAGATQREVECIVAYDYTPATRDYYDKAMGAWYPGDPAELEIAEITHAATKEPLPKWMFTALVDDNEFHRAMCDKAEEARRAEIEAAMEARAEP